MSEKENSAPEVGAESADIDALLKQREALETAFKEKFTRTLTVVFTDLKGSTAIAEKHGDIVSRQLIQHHNEIVFPAVKENHGTLVKSIGDGTLSHFESALDAVRAAVRIQKGMDELNRSGKFSMPVLMRIGMHTGNVILEKNDIFGDVVNTASRFESSATPGAIFISEETYNALSDKSEIYCRFEKEVTLKGKAEPYRAYKAFWNPDEITMDIQSGGKVTESVEPVEKPAGKPWVKYAIGFAVLAALVLALSMRDSIRSSLGENKRSINHSVEAPPQ